MALTFYFSKGSSALAAHILLEEVGVAYDAVEISIAAGAHRTPAFLARSPKGRIPLLETPEGGLTETPAILEYIAETHPTLGLQPKDPVSRGQARALCAYLCATAHVAAAHRHRGVRWATLESSLKDMRAQVPQNLTACARLLEDTVAFDPWAMGARFTFCDPYVFQFYQWLAASDVDLSDFPKLTAHEAAMRARPATQRAMAVHGLS